MASRAMRRAVLLLAASAAPALSGDACGESGTCRAAAPAEDARGTVLLQVQPAALSTVSAHKPEQHVGLASQCSFANAPETPYFWDPMCSQCEPDSLDCLGCFADSVHIECRYCGEHPYTGVDCPESAIKPHRDVCRFDNPPVSTFFWDHTCKPGDLGCKADGKHLGCRYCGGDGDYKEITCPQCTFPNEPLTPYFVDETCEMGKLGCRADGVHDHCRFCGKRPWHSIPCPDSVHIPEGECWFPNAPKIPYFWDEDCAMGKVGCWADGFHAECRFCGKGAYKDVECPDEGTARPHPQGHLKDGHPGEGR